MLFVAHPAKKLVKNQEPILATNPATATYWKNLKPKHKPILAAKTCTLFRSIVTPLVPPPLLSQSFMVLPENEALQSSPPGPSSKSEHQGFSLEDAGLSRVKIPPCKAERSMRPGKSKRRSPSLAWVTYFEPTTRQNIMHEGKVFHALSSQSLHWLHAFN